MSDKPSLLNHLKEDGFAYKPEKKFPNGIDYQEYVVEVEGKETTVYIPLRECDAFETTLSRDVKLLDKSTLRDVLRQHRGLQV